MKLIFSSLVTLILLGVYVFLIIHGIRVVLCIANENCTSFVQGDFTNNMASTLALIGGLVSALVIAELAVTKPGEAPGTRLLDPGSSDKRKKWTRIIAGVYLLVWMIFGLLAFIFGYLLTDNSVLPALADLGQAWLGVAVGAGYAYFGIKQP